jgi:glutaminyl-tRNA synthetase
VEVITHSCCTLEFSDHRPLYDWCLDHVDYDAATHGRPQQIEFARLNLNYTVMSKRKLRELVEKKYVNGWDDPRMPTISGLRRRGYTPPSIRDFCTRIGVAKRDSTVDIALLEHCVREDLNLNAARVMAVLRPLKVIIDNYPPEQVEWLEAENNPENPDMGTRRIPFSREIYIEQEDFMENPPKKYFRLTPGGEVRLKSAYIINVNRIVKYMQAILIELHCSLIRFQKGRSDSGRK